MGRIVPQGQAWSYNLLVKIRWSMDETSRHTVTVSLSIAALLVSLLKLVLENQLTNIPGGEQGVLYLASTFLGIAVRAYWGGNGFDPRAISLFDYRFWFVLTLVFLTGMVVWVAAKVP